MSLDSRPLHTCPRGNNQYRSDETDLVAEIVACVVSFRTVTVLPRKVPLDSESNGDCGRGDPATVQQPHGYL